MHSALFFLLKPGGLGHSSRCWRNMFITLKMGFYVIPWRVVGSQKLRSANQSSERSLADLLRLAAYETAH
jgi:hypothetical protein